MAAKSLKANLASAKKNKNDEFYTQLSDIESEVYHYRPHFKGKSVLLNCDDPEHSNFFRFFAAQFNILGLSRLVSTYYSTEKQPYKLVIEKDVNGDGKVNFEDLEKIPLSSNGDFRSDESIELLKEADIVVTNPPFSLFREFIALLEKYDKKFLVIGNQNAISYKEIFSLIKNNRIWMGVSPRSMNFTLPSGETKNVNACWFTNMTHKKRNEEMILFREYYGEDAMQYPKYDNYDAIEVSKTADIPKDYEGAMGVPITFLDKYNPEQFEIIALGIVGSIDFTKNRKMEILDQNGKGTGKYTMNAKGTLYRKYNPNTDKKPAFMDYETKELYSSIYARIIIKNKKPILK